MVQTGADMKKGILILIGITVINVGGLAEEERKMTLGEVLRTALEHNLDIKLQKLQVDAKKISFDLTKTVYEPTIGANTRFDSKDRAPNNSNEGPAGSTVTDETTTFQLTFSKQESIGLSWQGGVQANGRDSNADNSFGNFYTGAWWIGAEQSLLKNFSFDERIRKKDEYLARGNLELSNLDLELRMIDVLTQTETAYWDLINARENYTAIENSLNLAKQLYDQNKTKIEIGTLAPIELVFAESNVASKESELVSAENAVRQAEDVLRKVMNLPDEQWDQPIKPVDVPLVELIELDKEQAFKTAFASRVELEKQRIYEENEKLNYDYYLNQKKPDLKLSASYRSTGASYPFDKENSYTEAVSNAFGLDFPGYTVELILNWTPFNKANKLRIVEAELSLRQRALQLESTKKTIREEVRSALRELRSAENSIKANQKARKYREESLAAEIQKFQNGLTTNYQIAEAQDQLTTAISSEIRAKIAYRKAMVQYYKAVGNLTKNHGILVD